MATNPGSYYAGDDSHFPPGAQRPFMGQGPYGSNNPSGRESFASSHQPTYSNPDYASSAHALHNRYQDEYTPVGPVDNALSEKRKTYEAPRRQSRKKMFIIAGTVGAVILLAAAGVLVYVFAIRPRNAGSGGKTGKGNTGSSGGPNGGSNGVVTGGQGSTVTLEDGSTFVYNNAFGGTWYWDENDPFNNGARAQSWSPALNETFRYGEDQIRGVNLGGWLNLEPFISPAPFEKYAVGGVIPIDEWHLSVNMAADTANGGLSQLEDHYKTFITERDFADIAAAGLNFVRIPIGYWAIEVWEGEPFLPKVSWQYFLKAIQWARKYGIRIKLDLHALPGSQNGWNHSGREGILGWLQGPMGYANAQRSLDYVRILAEFISQPQYKDVVPLFGIVNEPFGLDLDQEIISRFFAEAYRIVREVGGVGEGNGPYVVIHDSFILPQNLWANFMPNGDRVALDSHTYMCFEEQLDLPMGQYDRQACERWGRMFNTSMSDFGLTVSGEFSLAVSDCGLFLTGVGKGTRYEGTFPGVWPVKGSCEKYTDWQNFSDEMKAGMRALALTSMDALQNYFFWTWKIGDALSTGKVETPAWSYKLGLEQGWMPTDPREAHGACGNTDPFVPPLKPWQTGGAGAGQNINTAAIAWPPVSLPDGNIVATLPSYTPTGTFVTLPGPTFSITSKGKTTTADAGSGWRSNAANTQGAHVPIPSCQYLDPWGNVTVPAPPQCGGGAVRRAPAPLITPPPLL